MISLDSLDSMISNDFLTFNGDDVSAYRGQVNWKRILIIWSRLSNDSDSEELDTGLGEAQRTPINKAREKLGVKK